ncbi:hypothetical protein DWC20_06485 [Clostridium botulinum]|uniref:hypothetical protein n=1 Tax=Clostridium botulinum TaxID=1491 RepID=UPI000361A568|nr:hypothetical protein [Clostridium botulinum]MBN1035198.1 hypothetical protein [Clostridium botulinum]NFG27006.1 hypothetical protein [Clostridium botulinum]NFG58012.1 hypothetical protein [Clostridium botulinum]
MKKRYFIVLSIIILSIILIYYFYPRKTTIGTILYTNCNLETIDKLYIRGVNSGNEQNFKSKAEINEILSYISNTEIIRYFGDTSKNRTKGSFEICLYENSDDILCIYTLGKEYLIIWYKDNSSKTYKVIDDSFDRDYINKVLS